jgi:hypothetical protein
MWQRRPHFGRHAGVAPSARPWARRRSYGRRVRPPPDHHDARGERPGRLAVLVEVVGLLVALLIFTMLHAAAGRDVASATAHARAVQSLERTLHVDIELATNRWLTGHPLLIQPAVVYYRLYYVVVIGVLIWVFIRHASSYSRVRRTVLAMVALVLPIYWAYPLSPPRFALSGVVDIVAEHDLLGGHVSRDLGNGQNHYSAMPSLHVGWSLWCAYAVWSVLRTSHPRLALLSWLFPLGMAAVVRTTGNHYVLDIAGSVVLLLTSIAAASAWAGLAERRRRSGRTQVPASLGESVGSSE